MRFKSCPPCRTVLNSRGSIEQARAKNSGASKHVRAKKKLVLSSARVFRFFHLMRSVSYSACPFPFSLPFCFSEPFLLDRLSDSLRLFFIASVSASRVAAENVQDVFEHVSMFSGVPIFRLSNLSLFAGLTPKHVRTRRKTERCESLKIL